MKFLIDMPLPPQLAEWLTETGHDAVHASDVGLNSAGDSEVMSWALSQGRIILTADLDYPHLLALANATAPAVILFRDGVWAGSEIKSRLAAILSSLPEIDIATSIIVVERERVRRRRLPLSRA